MGRSRALCPCRLCGAVAPRRPGSACYACWKDERTQTKWARHAIWFWSKVDAAGDCWLWTGSVVHGYGSVKTDKGHTTAHRFAYEHLVGPIPDGLHLDHLCRVALCVNPAHVEPVTRGENTRRGFSPIMLNRRKTHCPVGHPYDQRNTRINKRGQRSCRTCNVERTRAWRRATAA